MWRAKATEKLKLKAANIEAVKDKEVAERGLVLAGSTTEGSEGTQVAPEASAARVSTDEAATNITTSAQAEEEGRSADEAPLVTRKRRRLEQAAQQPPPGEQLSERSYDAHVVFEAVSSEHTPTQLDLPPTILEAHPSTSRTLHRLRRLGDRPVPIGESSGHAAASQDDSSGPRVIKTVLRFPSEEYLLAADRPSVPE